MARQPINLVGQRFGRLTVVGLSSRRWGGNRTLWLCICDCGGTAEVRGTRLMKGTTQSCGCLRDEVRIKIHTTHGGTKTRLFLIWSGMKGRCYRPSLKDYPRYGGRGIIVCDAWRDSFEVFRDWALSHGYSDTLTIERVDVNGNYEPENCTWIPGAAQARNRQAKRSKYTGGKRINLKELAAKAGLDYGTFLNRLRNGLSIEEALSFKAGERHRLRKESFTGEGI